MPINWILGHKPQQTFYVQFVKINYKYLIVDAIKPVSSSNGKQHDIIIGLGQIQTHTHSVVLYICSRYCS